MDTQRTYERFIKLEPYLHIVFWCFVFVYPYVKYSGREGGYTMDVLHELTALFFKMSISYILYLWLFPLKDKRKYTVYLPIIYILHLVGYEYFDRFFHTGEEHFIMHFMTNSLTYLSFGSIFYALYTFKRMYGVRLKLHAITEEKNKAELNALKAQINPHFLFNTLNTIYAKALKKDKETPDLILTLSNSFRYFLEEGGQDKVTIKEEIAHITDYIHLQEKRLSQKTSISFSHQIDRPGMVISPLLLISFIENAFKYTSLLKGNGHEITIKIILRNGIFNFECRNPFDSDSTPHMEWKNSGIGIKNTQKRLDLLYPDKHQLSIVRDGGIFQIQLKIDLR
ncbi:MAG: sensor histidine kinase [Flavobacteriaceae bacterium]